MESYVVRIYCRNLQGPSPLAGVVEVVQSGEKLAFHDSQQLWNILVTTEPGPALSGEKREPAVGNSKRLKGS